MFVNMNKYLTPETFLQQLVRNNISNSQTVWRLLGAYGTQQIECLGRISGNDRGDRTVGVTIGIANPNRAGGNSVLEYDVGAAMPA